MRLKSAVAAAGGAFLAVSLAAHAQPATPTEQAPASVPERQTTYTQSGIRLSLGGLVFGPNRSAMTLVIENTRNAPVHFAALSGRTRNSLTQIVLSDESGAACMARGNPAGIAEIAHLAHTRRSRIAAMTTIPPRSRINAVFDLGKCRLANPPVSFAGEFALSTDGDKVELVTVPFWGIMLKKAAR